MVKISLKGFPESYGDLDFFKLIEDQSFIENLRFNEIPHENLKQS